MLALGIGSLFNHARQPNMDYRVSAAQRCIYFSTAHRAVEAGEELSIFYGPDHKLWFALPPDAGVDSRSGAPAAADDGNWWPGDADAHDTAFASSQLTISPELQN